MGAIPLTGLRVLDLSKVLAGPLCAQYLGDMGADVIKVETLGDGDETRHWPPFRADLAPAAGEPAAGEHASGAEATGTVFLSANRNKRSLAVDLRSKTGLAVIHRLAEKADVVIESF